MTDTEIINQVVLEYPDDVQAIKFGQTQLIQMLMGQIMKRNEGKGNPRKIQEELLSVINQAIRIPKDIVDYTIYTEEDMKTFTGNPF